MVQRWNVCAIVFWRVVWYSAGTFLCMRSCPYPSWPWRGRRALDVVTSLDMAVMTWPWRPWMWLWRGAAVAVAPAVFCRSRVVATRRRTLVFPMVYVVSVLS